MGAEFFCIPLISAHFRALSPFRRGQAARLGPCGGHGWVAVELAADFVYCGHNRTFPGVGFLPVREWRFGAEIFLSRSFPLISERCLRTGGGRLFVGGRAGDTAGWLSNWRLILFFEGITGHFRVLGSCLCGSGGLVRKFFYPAHFRSFPSVASGQAGAGCSLGAVPGTRLGGCRTGG